MDALLVRGGAGGVDCDAYARNTTLGPLGIDYVYLHECTFAGAPLLSAAVLLLWLGALFFFRASTSVTFSLDMPYGHHSLMHSLSLCYGYAIQWAARRTATSRRRSRTSATRCDDGSGRKRSLDKALMLGCLPASQLNVPLDIAGVTFLAFGNGAPDVFSAVAAYAAGAGDAGVNALLGGAMFVSSAVVGCVAVASAVRVDRWPFTRDASALLGSLLLLLLLATAAEPPVLLFLLAYALYVGSVLVPECVARVRVAKHQVVRADASNSSTALVLSAFWHALSPVASGDQQQSRGAKPYEFITRTHAEHLAAKDGSLELASPKKQPAPRFPASVFDDHFQAAGSLGDSLSSPLISDDDRTEDSDVSSLLLLRGESDDDVVGVAAAADGGVRGARVGFTNGAGIIQSAYWRHLRWRWRLQRRILRVFASDDSVVVKVLSVPQALLVLVRDVTIPLLDRDAWSRPLATLAPITVPLFVLLTSGSLEVAVFADSSGGGGVPLWQLALVGGGAAAVAVSFLTHRSQPPKTFLFSLFFLSLAFASCVCWIYAVANELVALLVAVGVITHASNSLLGLTVLSWGNSVGDLVTNVSVARAGFPQMAIAGCFGGPVFNLLLGLGVPTTYAYLRGQVIDLQLDVHAYVSLGFLAVSLVASFVVFRHHSFRCPAWYGKLLIAYYAVYTGVNLAIAFRASLLERM